MTSEGTWLEQARPTPFPQIARTLGLTVSHKRWGPCPACGAAHERSGRRLPIGRVGDGWICNACRTSGDVIALVRYALGGDFRATRRWFEEQGPVPIETTETEAEPRVDPRPILLQSTPAGRSEDFDVQRFMSDRGYRDPPAWVLPDGWSAPWWPWRWFPLVVPAFTGSGILAGLHGRAVSPQAPRKTTWPRHRDSRGLLFADPRLGLPFLRRVKRPTQALIVEGMTDYLKAAEDRRGQAAVLGIASGSTPALRAIDFSGVEVYVGTDDDPAGRRYAEKVAEAVSPTPCRMLPLHLLRKRL